MKQVWTLDTIFQGGSASKDLAAEFDALEREIPQLRTFPLKESLVKSQNLLARLEQAAAFIHCLVAQNTSDQKAQILEAQMTTIQAQHAKEISFLDDKLKALSDQESDALLSSPELKSVRFALEERRAFALKRLPAEKEALIEDLAIDGYHGWGEYYHTLVSTLSFHMDGETLSQGQIENRLGDDKASVRDAAFKEYTSVYSRHLPQFAAVLNHLSGFRLKMYEARGWSDILFEPCHLNRIHPQTLESLWKAVSENLAPFNAYLKRKAQLLGLDKLSWTDVDAPIGTLSTKLSYEEGCQLIIDQFATLSPKMADFTKRALNSGWVEVEDRKGKRPGGFCINFPMNSETRIFMTYSGTMTNVATLAHELGHAFHADCCFPLPPLHQQYRMNVAETASTMAEMIVADAALKLAKSDEEKLSLLDDKVSRSVAFLMNLRARFLFETRFYAERAKGPLSPEKLSELMEKAQKEAYGDSLSHYHPSFWATKLHFYITDVPFYNFPYTFGYLFSLGIYAILSEDKSTFEERYMALLHDSGQMTTEELALRHLGVDLKEPTFWVKAVQLAAQDAEEFLKMSEKTERV